MSLRQGGMFGRIDSLSGLGHRRRRHRIRTDVRRMSTCSVTLNGSNQQIHSGPTRSSTPPALGALAVPSARSHGECLHEDDHDGVCDAVVDTAFPPSLLPSHGGVVDQQANRAHGTGLGRST
ncbi:hypothetical protein CFP66_37835 [Pseudonocardia sp. MH-G8]|nr:hypothetical protein CFP66_37835 [Pseudonocardia sp. MH-G8]